MRKHHKSATRGRTAGNLRPVFNDDPAEDDPHDAIDQELLGIWMSISRLRQMLRSTAPASPSRLVVALRPRPQPKRSAKTSPKKPRRNAA